MDFKLSKQTCAIIANFAKINDSIIFRPGKLITVVAKDGDAVGFAQVDDEFPDRFAVGSISKFLSILSLYDEPKLTVDGKSLVIKGGGARKFSLTLAAEKQIMTTEKDIDTFTKQFAEPESEFKLEAADLLAIKKNMNAAQLPIVSFTSGGGDIVVRASDVKNPTSDYFEMTLKSKSKKAFDIMFSDAKIQNMLENDYDIQLWPPKMVRFATGHKDVKIEYFNAPNRGSK